MPTFPPQVEAGMQAGHNFNRIASLGYPVIVARGVDALALLQHQSLNSMIEIATFRCLLVTL